MTTKWLWASHVPSNHHPAQGARRRDGLHLSKLESKIRWDTLRQWKLQSWTLQHYVSLTVLPPKMCKSVKYIASFHVKAGICDVLRIICVPQLFVAWAMHPNQFRTVIHNMQTCGELYVHLCGTYLFDMICIVYRTRIISIFSHICVQIAVLSSCCGCEPALTKIPSSRLLRTLPVS